MANVIDGVKYTKEHEWVKTEDNGIAVVGITDYAQEMLTDIVFVSISCARLAGKSLKAKRWRWLNP